MGTLALIMALTVKGIIELLIYSYDIHIAGVACSSCIRVTMETCNKRRSVSRNDY